MAKKQSQKKVYSSGYETSRDAAEVAAKKPGISLLPGVAAVFITLLCFSSALNNRFVNWDDDKNFYENPLVQNVTEENFWATSKAIFSSGVIGNYNPLPIWTFAIEKIVWGFDKPEKWHLTNVILHLGCVMLVFLLSRRLRLGWEAALLVALLFGIHPMRVESVTWVTERKDVLFGLFYLAAMLQYVALREDGRISRWVWIVLFFLLSCFSKIQAVSLPLSMIAVDLFLNDKKTSFAYLLRSALWKIPLLAISLGFGVYGVLELEEFGSLQSAQEVALFSTADRLAIGGYSFFTYLAKWIFPYRMSPLYPYPGEIPGSFYLAAVVIFLVTVALLYYAFRKDNKVIQFGFLFFIVNIIFLLQIVGAGQGFLADRFTYIAYFGLFFITGSYFESMIASVPGRKTALTALACVYLAVFGVMTIRQNNVWDNSETLWTHVLQYYDNSTLPYGNRANYFRDEKRYKEALADYNATLTLKADQAGAYNSRARLYFDVARTNDTLMLALNDYNKAIELEPSNGEYWINRGATYARLNNTEKAISDINHGLKLKPDHASGYLNRSIMYRVMANTVGNQGDRAGYQTNMEMSIKDIDSYLAINPNSPDLYYEKGNALNAIGKHSEALKEFNMALQFDSPNVPLYYHERSKAHFYLNKKAEAAADFKKAIELGFKETDPRYRAALGL